MRCKGMRYGNRAVDSGFKKETKYTAERNAC
jgi:hypothetical protein